MLGVETQKERKLPFESLYYVTLFSFFRFLDLREGKIYATLWIIYY